jgi:hypothetical protein
MVPSQWDLAPNSVDTWPLRRGARLVDNLEGRDVPVGLSGAEHQLLNSGSAW